MLISKILTIYLKLSKLIAYQITVGRKQTHQRLMTVKHFEGACILCSLLGWTIPFKRILLGWSGSRRRPVLGSWLGSCSLLPNSVAAARPKKAMADLERGAAGLLLSRDGQGHRNHGHMTRRRRWRCGRRRVIVHRVQVRGEQFAAAWGVKESGEGRGSR